MAAQTLEPLAVVACDLDLGVQREAVDDTAQLTRKVEWAGIATAADALDGAACSLSEHGGRLTRMEDGAEPELRPAVSRALAVERDRVL